jgi:hypothetical protein
MVFAMFGFGVAAVTMSLGARYLSLFLMLGGVYGSYNVALAWISSTVSNTVIHCHNKPADIIRYSSPILQKNGHPRLQ